MLEEVRRQARERRVVLVGWRRWSSLADRVGGEDLTGVGACSPPRFLS